MTKSAWAVRLGMPLVLMGAIGGGYLLLKAPAAVPPSSATVPITPTRVTRGEYVYRLAGCDNCHSPRDWTRFGGPVIPSLRGAGLEFPPDRNLPGRIVAGNITPDRETGIGEWTDGEKIRAIRDGIGRDGRALYSMMPYRRYRKMSDEDVFALVAYLNTLPKVRHHVPMTQLTLAAGWQVKDRPRPAGVVAPLDSRDTLKYGEYLTTLAGCTPCHTSRSGVGRPAGAMRLAGGRRISLNGLSVMSANITPDLRSGIGSWSEDEFLDRMYLYREYVVSGSPKVGPENFTVMPWLSFSGLEPADLKAIYAYLRTQKPVYHVVQPHPVAETR